MSDERGNSTIRTHVLMPREIVDEIDHTVGKRKRSEFLAEAAREKLGRSEREAILRASIGKLDLSKYPAWRTPEDVSAWVHALRHHPEQLAVPADPSCDVADE